MIYGVGPLSNHDHIYGFIIKATDIRIFKIRQRLTNDNDDNDGDG